MKRSVCFVFVALSLTCGWAQQVESGKVTSNYLHRTGGRIKMPVQGTQILILNMQEKVQESTLTAFISELEQLSGFPVTIEKAKTQQIEEQILGKLSDKKSAVIIALIEGRTALTPTLLVAPENRWAMINVAVLSPSGVKGETVLSRTQKEIWRAMGFLLGAGISINDACLMKPVFNLSDLDNLKCNMYSPEIQSKIAIQAPLLNLKPLLTTTYRKACEEGWAPMPTNSIQKAIWEDVKAKKTPGKEKK